MLINILLWILSAVVVAVLYALTSALSLWWLPLLLVGSYAAGAVLELTLLLLWSCFMRKAMPSQARRLFYRVISHTAEWVVLLCGTRARITGGDRLPKDIPFLLVSNHLSNLDPLVKMAALRDFELPFVSKPENFKIPLAGPIMRNASFLPIDRENPRNAVATIKAAAAHITERGLCVGIYPEGTRNKTGEGLLPFHNGSFKIATTAKCPLAVLTLQYEKATFPYRCIARIRVVEVLDADYVAANRTDAISERARAIVEEDLNK